MVESECEGCQNHDRITELQIGRRNQVLLSSPGLDAAGQMFTAFYI